MQGHHAPALTQRSITNSHMTRSTTRRNFDVQLNRCSFSRLWACTKGDQLLAHVPLTLFLSQAMPCSTVFNLVSMSVSAPVPSSLPHP